MADLQIGQSVIPADSEGHPPAARFFGPFEAPREFAPFHSKKRTATLSFATPFPL
jgi:hypothetical protein